MYNTKSIHDNRFIAKCIALVKNALILDFMVDTGAIYTCCNAWDIDVTLTEEEVAKNSVFKTIGGIVAGHAIRFYRFRVKQFTIGTIDCGARDIWITFDKLATNNVLGMDILKDVRFEHNPQTHELVFHS